MKRIETDFVTLETVGSLRSLNERIFPILAIKELQDSFYRRFTENLHFAIIATYDKKLAGFVCCERVANNSLYVRLIGTVSRYRRRGVGGALMGKVMEEAAARQVRSVYAYVRGDNRAALVLNRKFGLTSTGETAPRDRTSLVVEKVF